MLANMSAWGRFSGRDDVQPALHVPMVYESVAASPVQWEYRVVSVDPREEAPLDEERLSALGAEGWLLVGLLEPSQPESRPRVYYYFARQK